MKPLKLRFKGVNSFSENTVIDFDGLTKSGIFGIFGDTGSGKSTILDCINFALYGKVERSREKLDIINYRCDAAEVKFDFDALYCGTRKTYSIERSIKRKSGTHAAKLYEDGACIADSASAVTKKITEILGVDAEDFRKCIALPQGEFSQFVKSQPSERIALIERLFSLSKYGDRLKEKLKLRGDEANIAYQTLSAQLQLYSDVSAELLKEQTADTERRKDNADAIAKQTAQAEKEYLALKALSEKRAELDSVSEQLAQLQKRKPQTEELRAGLKAVPVCRTAVDLDGDITEKTLKIAQMEKSVNEFEERIKLRGAELAELKAKYEKLDFDGKIAECIDLAAKYATCADKPQKLNDSEKQLEAKRTEFRKKEEELSKLNRSFENMRAEVEAAEKALSECGVKDLDSLINVDFKAAVLKQEYVNSLDYFADLNSQVKLFDNDTELYGFIAGELKKQIAIFKDRVYQVKDFNLKDAEERLKSFCDKDGLRSKLNEALNNKRAALKDGENAIKECGRELKQITADGEKIRARADEIKAELEKIFGKGIKDYSAAVKANSEKRAKLESEKQRLEKQTAELQNILNGLISGAAAAKAQLNSSKTELLSLENKLKNTLSQSGFGSIERCRKLIEEFESYPDAEKALKDYDTRLISLQSRREQLSKTDGIFEFSEKALACAEENKNKLSQTLARERESIAVLQDNCNKAKIRLKEKRGLQKRFYVAEKNNNLIAQLKELTKGNKFMEFIANEYLYDISYIASATLLNLTDGRYFLTYTDTFYAGDNFNCGKLRGVNTLSGGETFLVSLSLALALSQTICASLKSVEFFFLDEGFGTLDGALVDTVMNALEKLKSSRFTIGVISHVEELKHRIDSKIIVNKATESHGSTVQISC